MTDIEKHNAKDMGEVEVRQLVGPDVAGFMKAVAKAGKKYGIHGCVFWVMHRNIMRVASFGYAPNGREQARTLATWLQDQAALLLQKPGGSA